MKDLRYRVGGHLIDFHFTEEADTRLIASFAPFKSDEEGEPVVSLTVERHAPAALLGEEIGQFDCGGNNHGVYRLPDGGYQIEVAAGEGTIAATIEADALWHECHVGLTATREKDARFGLGNCVMMAYAFATAPLETLLMHASVIRKDGFAYPMTAPSGTGKSTHTHLWYENIEGCDLMNDDNPVVRVEGEKVVVYGSPWSGKTPCYRNIEAPCGAFVHLHQAPHNEIRRLGAVEAFAALLPAMSSMKWDRRIHTLVADTVAKLVARTPVYDLRCLPNREAALLCYQTVGKRV